MKFLNLILKNTLRNRRRTLLTILSIGMSLFLMSTLLTLLNELESPPLTPESAKRVIVRHKVSLGVVLPISYREKIKQVPGVEAVVATQWFGGIYKDPSYFFAQFAVDAGHFFDVYSEVQILSGEKEAFIKERTASLAGEALAKRYGWKVGDRITLKGAIFPVDVETIVRGIVTGGGSENAFYFHWDYFNELLSDAGVVGTFAVKAHSAEEIPAIIEAVDGMSASSTAPTKTETEKAFLLGFTSMWGNVRTLVMSISTVILFTIVLVAANTMAMSIRERTGEIAILKALGFQPGHVLGLMLAESLLIALAGGLAGSLGARYLFGALDFNSLTLGFIPRFDVRWETVLMAVGVSAFVAFTSTAIPAWNASRLAIADGVRRRGE